MRAVEAETAMKPISRLGILSTSKFPRKKKKKYIESIKPKEKTLLESQFFFFFVGSFPLFLSLSLSLSQASSNITATLATISIDSEGIPLVLLSKLCCGVIYIIPLLKYLYKPFCISASMEDFGKQSLNSLLQSIL
jgi:hypothetical protein